MSSQFVYISNDSMLMLSSLLFVYPIALIVNDILHQTEKERTSNECMSLVYFRHSEKMCTVKKIWRLKKTIELA